MPIEVVSPELGRIVSPDAAVTELSSGYGGADGPAGGPLWWHEGRLSAVQRHPQQPQDEVDGPGPGEPVP